MIKMICSECGPVDKAHFDGYAIGDRLLEGVMFTVKPGETVSAELDSDGEIYFKSQGIAKKKWLPEAVRYVTSDDGAESLVCTNCNEPGLIFWEGLPAKEVEKAEPKAIPAIKAADIFKRIKP